MLNLQSRAWFEMRIKPRGFTLEPTLENGDVLGFLGHEFLGLLHNRGDVRRIEHLQILVAALLALQTGLQRADVRKRQLAGPNRGILRSKVLRPCKMRGKANALIELRGLAFDLGRDARAKSRQAPGRNRHKDQSTMCLNF